MVSQQLLPTLRPSYQSTHSITLEGDLAATNACVDGTQRLPSLYRMLQRISSNDTDSRTVGRSVPPFGSLFHFETGRCSRSHSPRLSGPCKRNYIQIPSDSRRSALRTQKHCRMEGCFRIAQRQQLCHRHGGKRYCKAMKCSSKDRGNGYCIKHGGGKSCIIEGCRKKSRKQSYCTQHYRLFTDPDELKRH
ncbi:unnamed protein product [Albugo candida]|uniref:Uncharacterized protein n=1 Tax=Albugo candida TaxID=65357 RepID=A0A024GDI9_9STRA|nr:unnamed protein product [Albugo candida]|eukprot:CCI44763.1 unnamed protein product [Albugo candida]